MKEKDSSQVTFLFSTTVGRKLDHPERERFGVFSSVSLSHGMIGLHVPSHPRKPIRYHGVDVRSCRHRLRPLIVAAQVI